MPSNTIPTPLRVAIIGSGPAAFYAVEHFFKQSGLNVCIDMYDRLPTPYGLVRGGVAPDHQKIKGVSKVFERVASDARFRFYGNVEYGKHILLEDLKDHYHQVLYATGAQTDKHMGIPGENLKGSHPATEFVAWYNGHPDFTDCKFDLSQEQVAIVGVGNVAIDVARILCLSPDELARTDMADYAIAALSMSRIKQVHLLGRRGPAQAAFTNPEIRELGELADAEVLTLPDEVALDPLSKEAVEKSTDLALKKKVEILQGYALPKPTGKTRTLTIRFLVSPVEIIGNADGSIARIRLVRNVLYKSESGTLSPKPTDIFEELPVGLVFRSVGYRGVALQGVPFDERKGVVPNEKGRIIDPTTKQPMTGEYVTGWIKRGPTGVIGTNKPDSVETVNAMLEDWKKGASLRPVHPEPESIEMLVRERQPENVPFMNWVRLDQIEIERGRPQGRPRVKFTRVQDMLDALREV